MQLDRRDLFKLATGLLVSATIGEGATLTEAEVRTLAQLLGLEASQGGWLADLTPPEQEELRRALAPGSQGPASPRTVQLLARVLGPRSRLYAFLDYPQVEDQRSVCDGLMRE